MKPLTIDPLLKFLFLVIQIITILICQSNVVYAIIVITSSIYIVMNKVSIKIIINGLKYGVLLTVFIFIFTYMRYQDLQLARINGVELIRIYLGLILLSIAYKINTTNKELAYVLSVIFSPLKIIGYDQNKLYTMFLMILNQIYIMRESAIRIHKYAKFKNKNKLSISQTTKLIIPFINNNLKQNELLAIGLLNSGYGSNQIKVKPYFIKNYKISHYVILLLIEIIELIIIIGG